MKVALGLAGFIWIYQTLHLKSIFLSTFALINILMSVPITLVLYNYVFSIHYLSLLHILSILIVLALGTDDVFVFNDIWN